MYTLINAFSDVIYELISTISPVPMINFDIEKHPQRLYVYAARKMKDADYNTVCDCTVYCCSILGKNAKNMVFSNIHITNEGLLSLMRLAKRYKEKDLKTDTDFIINEMCKVVKKFNNLAIEAVGEAIIHGITYDEYIKKSEYKEDYKIDEDGMWVLTHTVLNKTNISLLNKTMLFNKISYRELANIYLSKLHNIDIDALQTYYKTLCNNSFNNEAGANVILRALNDGIDLTSFLKEKRIKKIASEYIIASDYYPVINNRKINLKFDDKTIKSMIIKDILNALYYARLSGVSEDTLINYLHEREKIPTKIFYEHIDNDMVLLEKGITV